MARPAGLTGKRAALVPTLLLAATLSAAARASAVDGQALFLHGSMTGAGVPPCAACHGVDGHGRPGLGAPPLAGLGAPGVLANLATLASGGGDNAAMQVIAGHLSPDERAAVAAYIATLR